MGYYAIGNGTLRVRVTELDDAYRCAMTTLSELPWFNQVDTAAHATDLGDLLNAVFDDVTETTDVDINEFVFSDLSIKQGRWVSDTFDAVAPFVLVGHVDWRGEDGDLWQHGFEDGTVTYRHAEFDDELMEKARATLREIVDFVGSEHASCRDCDMYLPADLPCPSSEDGQHDPDLVLTDPPQDKPTREIGVAFTITVPNDGHQYDVDVTGRLEHLLSLLLLHPLISRASTGGPTGSGWVND